MAKKTKKKAVKKKADKKKAAKTTKKKKKSAPSTNSDVYDDLREDAEKTQKFSGSDFWSPPKGKVMVRPVPFVNEDGKHKLIVEQVQHWVQLGDKKRPYPCGSLEDPEDCPLCQLQESSKLTDKMKNQIKASRRYLMNLIVRESVDHDDEDTLVIGQLPKTAAIGGRDHKGIQDHILSDDLKDPLHPKTGRDFRISKSGSGFKTVYSVVPHVKSSPWKIAVTPVDLSKFTKRMPLNELEDIASEVLSSV